jgi:ketosteroid isomerase-like protein
MSTLRSGKSAAAAAIFVSGIISTSLAGSAHAATLERPQDVREITALETDSAGQADIDKLMRYFAKDAVAADMGTPGWYQGHDEIYAAYQPQLAAVQSHKFHMDDINIASDGNLACAAMRIQFDATLKDNSSVSMHIRQLDALKKIGGHWRIIQQHASLPVDAKTGSAVWNGQLPARGPLKWADNIAPRAAVSPAQAKKEIVTWLDSSATADIDELMRHYGPGDDFILYDVFSPGEHRGLRDVRDYYVPMLSGAKSLEVKVPTIAVESDGILAVQIDKQDVKISMADGTSHTMSVRQSDCLRRVDGKWYSFFEMASFPIDMRTGKAVMTDSPQ